MRGTPWWNEIASETNATFTATKAAPPQTAYSIATPVSGAPSLPYRNAGIAAAKAESAYTAPLKARRERGRRSTSWAATAATNAISTAVSQPKRMRPERMNTNASETELMPSTSSGTGFSSARSASPRNNRIAVASRAPGGSRAMLTAAPATTGTASAMAHAISRRSRGA